MNKSEIANQTYEDFLKEVQDQYQGKDLERQSEFLKEKGLSKKQVDDFLEDDIKLEKAPLLTPKQKEAIETSRNRAVAVGVVGTIAAVIIGLTTPITWPAVLVAMIALAAASKGIIDQGTLDKEEIKERENNRLNTKYRSLQAKRLLHTILKDLNVEGKTPTVEGLERELNELQLFPSEEAVQKELKTQGVNIEELEQQRAKKIADKKKELLADKHRENPLFNGDISDKEAIRALGETELDQDLYEARNKKDEIEENLIPENLRDLYIAVRQLRRSQEYKSEQNERNGGQRDELGTLGNLAHEKKPVAQEDVSMSAPTTSLKPGAERHLPGGEATKAPSRRIKNAVIGLF